MRRSDKRLLMCLVCAAITGYSVGVYESRKALTQDVSPVVCVSPPRSPSIPLGYYNSKCPMPEGVALDDWLESLKWKRRYEEGTFDCSQMTAAIEWAVESCGYSAFIAIVPEHSLLMISQKGNWTFFEATKLRILPPEKRSEFFFTSLLLFADLYSIEKWYQAEGKEERWLSEWGWWDEDGPEATWERIIDD